MDAERTAADAFGPHSDETRLDVLRTVATAQFDVLRTSIREFHRHHQDGTWTADRVDEDSVPYRVESRHENATLRPPPDDEIGVGRTERVRRDALRDRSS